jgi:hypothetical protein
MLDLLFRAQNLYGESPKCVRPRSHCGAQIVPHARRPSAWSELSGPAAPRRTPSSALSLNRARHFPQRMSIYRPIIGV